MIACHDFYNTLKDEGVQFFCGVPDSLLKSICAYISDHEDKKHHIITANEGSAVALASGYYLGKSSIPLVYMQNSGIGNAINPLVSLCDPAVYSFPLILMIGWRGEPGIKDEPQHVKQGEITKPLLDAMNIHYEILGSNSLNYRDIIKKSIAVSLKEKRPVALLIKKGTFTEYKLQSKNNNNSTLLREEAISLFTSKLKNNDRIIATTGKISRELYEHRENQKLEHYQDFLTVGSMGHASSIALGLNISNSDIRVFCFDGDGAMLMHMGNAAINAQYANRSFFHIVFNNQAHESVGGQPTIAGDISLKDIAKSCGYKTVTYVKNSDDLSTCLNQLEELEGPVFIEIMVKNQSRDDLCRPDETPQNQKDNFMEKLRNIN